jgi:DNA (cytosine-5)-methyltransferase 1
MGYHRAGFDVTGVDIVKQPRYPFEFIQADATRYLKLLLDTERHGVIDPEAANACGYLLSAFDVIHASPPCQGYSRMSRAVKTTAPKLIPAVRELLEATKLPYVIENVEGADLRGNIVMLCGTMFCLRLRRHRLFEIGTDVMMLTPPCDCKNGVASGRLVGQMLSGKTAPGRRPRAGLSETERPDLFGVPWMTPMEARQAIPPAYTEFIGRQLLRVSA